MATKRTIPLKEQLRQKEENAALAKAVGLILLGTAGVSIILFLSRGSVSRFPILAPEEQ